MGILESTVGHSRIHKALIHALVQGRLPSQFLFVGPEGVGKKRFAWGMAEVLLCREPVGVGQACGLCSSCVKIRSGFHENVLFIEPEKNLIKIEKAREIQDFLSLAQEGGARVIIVDDAHTLNPQASNALLKVFEEPPENTYFFFITHRWTQVLPTIRSRASRVAFAPLSNEALSRWAEGDARLLNLARGSVKHLLEQKEEGRSEFRDEAMRLWQQFFSDPSFIVLGDWRERVKDKEKLLAMTRVWLMALRDFFWHQSLGPEVAGGLIMSEAPFALMARYPEEELWGLWERGLALEVGILGHRDPVLLIEEWLFPVLLKTKV